MMFNMAHPRRAGSTLSKSVIERPSHSRFARLHPRAYLGMHGIVGLAVAAACTWAFFAIAGEVPEKGMMVRVDLAVTNWLQVHGTERGESIFSAISLLGSPVLAALILMAGVVLLARRDWRHLMVLCTTCCGGALLNGVLKVVFRRARPSFASEFSVTSWSFPSGHAMDSLIVYGLFAYWIASQFPRVRLAAIVGATVLVATIGYARIYLGVHYLSDVVAGYSAGLIWLAVCITGYQFAERRRVGPGGPEES
jgi:undecaprenyl-diphosphatase